MKTWKIVTIMALAILGVTVATSSVYAYMGRAVTNGGYPPTAANAGTYSYGGGMMGGRGMMGGNGYAYIPTAPTQPTTPMQPTNPAYPVQNYGGMGCGMINRGAYVSTDTYPATATPINITAAANIAQTYVVDLGNPNFAVSQIEEYTQNFYVQVKETNTGAGAFELLINKATGAVSSEPGPNMMWNTKYGMMANGVMGNIYTFTPTTVMPVNATAAATIAQQYLNGYQPGTTTGDLTTFYGYYTIEVLNGATTYGMLSVNGYTGQVWYHTWHGTFLQELTIK